MRLSRLKKITLAVLTVAIIAIAVAGERRMVNLLTEVTERMNAAKGYVTPDPPIEQILDDDFYLDVVPKFMPRSLPSGIVIRYMAPPNHPEAMALTDYNVDHFEIFMDPKYFSTNRKAADMTLYHEACHIATWKDDSDDDHGEAWTKCMTGLSVSGAFKGVW